MAKRKRTAERSPSSKYGTRNLKTAERRRIRARLWAEQLGFCAICGLEMRSDEVSLDHIVHVSQGGRNRIANFRATHLSCNVRRKDK